MEINKQLFEDVLAGKLKGTFVLRNGDEYFSDKLHRNYTKLRFTHPYVIGFRPHTPKGIFVIDDISEFDIIDFIPDTDMKENELTIEIPDTKVVDWDESKKQNKIVLKDKQPTYEDICKKLMKDVYYYINSIGWIQKDSCDLGRTNSNVATSEHQLECILAKNYLANVAKYLNDGWKPSLPNFGYFICVCNKELEILERNSYKFNNNVIFKSKELAQQAIEILGEETITLALEPLGI